MNNPLGLFQMKMNRDKNLNFSLFKRMNDNLENNFVKNPPLLDTYVASKVPILAFAKNPLLLDTYVASKVPILTKGIFFLFRISQILVQISFLQSLKRNFVNFLNKFRLSMEYASYVTR